MISYSNSGLSNSIFEQFKHWHISEHTNPFFLQLQRKESQFVFLHEHILSSITNWRAGSLSVRNGSYSSSIFFHPRFSGSGKIGFVLLADFHIEVMWWLRCIIYLSAENFGGNLSDSSCFFENICHRTLKGCRYLLDGFCSKDSGEALLCHQYILPLDV